MRCHFRRHDLIQHNFFHEIRTPQQAKRNEHPSFDSGFYVFQNTCLCIASVGGMAFNVRPHEFLN